MTDTAKLAALIGIVARVQREMHEILVTATGYTPGGVVRYSQLQAWERALERALRDQAADGPIDEDQTQLLAAYIGGANDANDGVKCKRATFEEWKSRNARAQLVHVIDQSGQPYGSVRRCCNRCGAMASPDMRFVESLDEWRDRPDNCSKEIP